MKGCQLSFLGFEVPAPVSKPDKIPKSTIKPATPTKEKPRWADSAFLQLCKSGTAMMFLYGQNQHVCLARTHGTDDLGKDIPMMRKDAERILNEYGYQKYSKYQAPKSERSGPLGSAVVYVCKARRS